MKFFQSTGKRNWLILCNILLICAMLLTTAVYSGTIMKQKNALFFAKMWYTYPINIRQGKTAVGQRDFGTFLIRKCLRCTDAV